MSFMYSGLRSTRDAVVVSSDILLLSVRRQAALVSFSVSSSPRIALPHLVIQIRYAASETRIFISLVAPAFGWVGATFGLLRRVSSVVCILDCRAPHPSIVPKVISGHVSSPCGHISFAKVQMSWVVGCVHSIKIWFIVSSSSPMQQSSKADERKKSRASCPAHAGLTIPHRPRTAHTR